ncbi:HpcH/HpaI aldolase family protein [Planococcus lenghuensis]|uniref:HpcH/HpaI aldolase/citrate lyase domain-containing protein n=1 Tax=Planococcus lenghuensis TaxID=2213202 RepID=A0A1Q2L331_9BACL|nr:aldolase/citrate lyase family protein [Planococcus lenghuensis]AQQ54875.1 hypothetical protein B0X71_18385 [Planococcus lenghuensis]
MANSSDKDRQHEAKQGSIAVGSFILGHDPEVVRVAAAAGLDFLIIDIEHGTPTQELVGRFVDTAQNLALRVFVRCSMEDLPFLGSLFDRGLDGAIVAGAETPEDVRNVIRTLKFAPLGTRGLNPFVPGTGYGTLDAATFMKEENTRTSVWIMAEKVNLVKRIDRISQLDGLDGVFFGPYDLSADLGVTGEVNNPAVTELIAGAVQTVTQNGRAAGIFSRDIEAARRWAEQGMSFLAVGFDWPLLMVSWKGIAAAFREEGREK